MWQKDQKFQIQEGGRTPYWKSFLLINRLHTVRLKRNFEFGGIISRKKYYISISQPQIVQIARNLVWRHKYYRRRRKRQKNQKIASSKWRMDPAGKYHSITTVLPWYTMVHYGIAVVLHRCTMVYHGVTNSMYHNLP